MREIFETRQTAEVYDRLYRSTLPGSSVEGDLAFYCALARRTGGPVLELGCGTGRVAFPLAAAGCAVTGLDVSPQMLRVARAKAALLPPARRPVFLRGDMTRFALRKRFQLALIPFRAFQHLLTWEAQRRCLECVRRHLVPGGRLVVDLFDPRLEMLVPGAIAGARSRREFADARGRLTVLARRTANDPVRQILRESWEFTERDPRGRVTRRSRVGVTLRWTYRWEMRHLLELAGFEVLACHGDFRGSGPTYGVEQVWVARRA